MELFIETLTGAAFELRVSPFETVMSVKAKIQRLEGIPISQQHLIWQSVELEDDYCLHDYRIHDGATLKLVLAMRGGPINTRRIPMDDPALREMAEYVEANREEIWEKLPGNRQVTLLVFREGDQLNFFRVIDKGDGTLTPLSDSLSGASMYNLNDEEDYEEQVAPGDQVEENDKLKETMNQLKIKMEKVHISKKPKKKPRPPSTGRPGSRSRIRHLTGQSLSHGLNKNPRLPPVGQTLTTQLAKEERISSSESEELIFNSDGEKSSPEVSTLLSPTLTSRQLATCVDSRQLPESVTHDGATTLVTPAAYNNTSLVAVRQADAASQPTVGERSSAHRPQSCIKNNELLSSIAEASKAKPIELSAKNDFSLDGIKDSLKPPSSKNRSKKKDLSIESLKDVLGYSKRSSKKDFSMDNLKSSIRPTATTSRYPVVDRRKEFTLESLSNSEARAVSGILRQASLERLGTSRIGNFVTSATKSRRAIVESRVPTPDGRLMSAQIQRMSASRSGRIMSPSHRLPPVKTKKRPTKRCFVCAKKTGLATSYQCRCGNNFCAIHRYAESHDCTFDYKTEGRKILEQSNPVVSAPKLPKI